ncbi:YihY/virulence factor BrkB family protein [Pontibacter russatus]|uniref:YihY/virulence factor BrkB family protein n=1 Tax=Pontibacter russatus TaxID=2694929 RepID=UPI00137B2AA2|nr:YihY/virulence factor BrkB family protein [Pontibacter russatus]
MAEINAKSIFSLIKTSASEFMDNNSFRLAGALAFNAIFSIPPLLIIIIRSAGYIWGEAAVSGELSKQIGSAIGAGAAKEVENIVQNAATNESGGIAFWISIGVLIFASTTFFATLQESLNSVWNLKPKPNNSFVKMLKVRLFSFGIVLSIALLMLVSLVLSTAISVLSGYLSKIFPDIAVFFIRLVDFVLSAGIISVLFALIYKYLPDANIRWKDVWVGAIVTALLFALGKFLISFYISTSDPGSAYGAAGSIIVILVWIYYSSLIIFFGSELAQQYADKFGQHIRPKSHAVFVELREVRDEPHDTKSGRPRPQGRYEPK